MLQAFFQDNILSQVHNRGNNSNSLLPLFLKFSHYRQFPIFLRILISFQSQRVLKCLKNFFTMVSSSKTVSISKVLHIRLKFQKFLKFTSVPSSQIFKSLQLLIKVLNIPFEVTKYHFPVPSKSLQLLERALDQGDTRV